MAAHRNVGVLTASLLSMALLPLGCAVRTGGPVASVETTPTAPKWPSRHADQAAIALSSESRGVELLELSRTDTARVYEVQRDGSSDALAVIEAPGYRARWTFPSAADSTAQSYGEAKPRLLVVSSTDISVKFTKSSSEGATSDDAPPDFVTFAQALTVAVRMRPAFVCGPKLSESRGICVLTPGLGGWTSVEQSFMVLASRGWTVVGLMPDFLRSSRTSTRTMLKFAGDDILRSIDSELAEDAFVVEAVLRELVREEPLLAKRPLVLVGSSLGALVLPAIAARIDMAAPIDGSSLPDVSAAVLIGGGAGLGSLMLDSGLGRYWLEVAGIDFETADRAALREQLDSRCAIAPERCLWALSGRPVLLIDATFDAIVPRSTADRLWHALGEPERWSYPVGHIGLFVLVGDDEWGKAVDWIDAQANGPQGGEPFAGPDAGPYSGPCEPSSSPR